MFHHASQYVIMVRHTSSCFTVVHHSPQCFIMCHHISSCSGWWYIYPSEKYEFVSWDNNIPNIPEAPKRKNRHNVGKSVPECVLVWECVWFTKRALGQKGPCRSSLQQFHIYIFYMFLSPSLSNLLYAVSPCTVYPLLSCKAMNGTCFDIVSTFLIRSSYL